MIDQSDKSTLYYCDKCNGIRHHYVKPTEQTRLHYPKLAGWKTVVQCEACRKYSPQAIKRKEFLPPGSGLPPQHWNCRNTPPESPTSEEPK